MYILCYVQDSVMSRFPEGAVDTFCTLITPGIMTDLNTTLQADISINTFSPARHRLHGRSFSLDPFN